MLWPRTSTHRLQNLLFAFFSREVDGALYKCQMGVGLWKITQQSLTLEVYIFTEKSQVVGVRQQFFEKLYSNNHATVSQDQKKNFINNAEINNDLFGKT